MMRRLLKITDNLARLIAVIDIGKQICEHVIPTGFKPVTF